MKSMVWLWGVLLLSHLTGCASLPTLTGNAPDQTDDRRSQRAYGEAVAPIVDVEATPSADIGNPQERQERINSDIASYEEQVKAEAERAVAANGWEAAFALYRDARSRLPESQPLQQGEQELIRRHAEHLDKLELEGLIAKGEWTLKDLDASKVATANHAPGWLEQYALKRKIAAAEELALELAAHGKRALERKDLPVAQRVLPLAMHLSNASEIKALNAKLQEMRQEEELRILTEQQRLADAQRAAHRMRVDQQNTTERATSKRQEQKAAQRLLADFKKACHERNFVKAQHLGSRLQTQGVDDPEFDRLRTQLESDVATHVKHLIKIGVVHYSQQEYDEAITVWKQAHVLDPKNEQLANRIKRATRVKDKLRTLRMKNGASQ